MGTLADGLDAILASTIVFADPAISNYEVATIGSMISDHTSRMASPDEQMECAVLWPAWPPRAIACNNDNSHLGVIAACDVANSPGSVQEITGLQIIPDCRS